MSTHRHDEEQARAALAALYGESTAPGDRETSEWEAARALMEDLMAEPPAPAVQERMTAGVVAAIHSIAPAEPEAPRLTVARGAAWVCREGAAAWLPWQAGVTIGPRDSVAMAQGSQGYLAWADGTRVAMAAGTRARLATGGDTRIALEKGRLYAWVAPQSSGRFAIETPAGSVAVLGTEFDLELAGDDRMEVAVVEGVVEYRKSANEAPIRLERGMAARRTPAGAEVRVMKPGEMRRRVAWAGATAARRGMVRTALVIGGAMVGMGVLLFVARPVTTTPATTGDGATAAALAAGAPRDNSQPPAGWQRHVYTFELTGPNWLARMEGVYFRDRGPAGTDGLVPVRQGFLKLVPIGHDGRVHPQAEASMRRSGLTSVVYTSTIDPTSGQVISSGSEGTSPTGEYAASALLTMELGPANLAPRAMLLAPGATMTDQREGRLRRDEGVRYRYTTRMTRVADSETPQFIFQLEGSINNILQSESTAGGVYSRTIVDERVSRQSGRIELDPFGSLVEYEVREERLTKARRVIEEPGKQAISNELPAQAETYVYRMRRQ